jgi:hypothetical protein
VADADLVRIGFEPARITGRILVAAAHRGALEALNGAQATLSDGTSSWQAVAILELVERLDPAEGAAGQAAFTRVGSA